MCLSFPNTGILLSQIIPNSRISLGLNFPSTVFFFHLTISTIVGFSGVINFPNTGIFLSLTFLNIGILIVSNLPPD